MDESAKYLLDKVVANNYCIGCGICASIEGSPFTMKIDEDGKYVPVVKVEDNNHLAKIDLKSICPFSEHIPNETQIGKEVFTEYGNNYDEHIGYYLKNYAGYVKEGEYREKGSSGGMGNWLAAQLVKKDLVDGVIHVKPNPNSNESSILFEYGISKDMANLVKGAKSKYYPIELSKVVDFVKNTKGRYALIGIPCFIKSVRLLARQDQTINERINYYIGLVCGHLKSDMFAKSMAWQMGIEPENLTGIDFRKKLEGRAANNYGVKVEGIINGDNRALISPTKDLYTTNWGHGLFKYNACEYCDDVLSETADVTIGDAWLPEYTNDSMGTNIIIVRHPVIQELLVNAGDKVHLEELSPEKVYQSQAGGFRHRRQGLAYRLHLKNEKNEWVPPKRVKPSNNISSKRKKIYENRMTLSQQSFKAFKVARQENNFESFIDFMDPLINEYNRINKPNFTKRVLRKIKRGMYKIIR